MRRDELLKFALDVSRDEYNRAYGRLALIETKAQLIAVSVGIFATLLISVGPDRLPFREAPDGLLCLGIIFSLGTSLVFSLAASMLAIVRPPPEAEVTCTRCAELVGQVGDISRAVDVGAAETVVGDMSAAYLVAAKDLTSLLAERTAKMKVAQVALLFGVLLTVVWLGLPVIGSAIALFNKGG
jgi:hypothetical protein